MFLGAEVLTRLGRLFRRLASRASCFAFRRALKGLGLRLSMGVITTEGFSVVGRAEAGALPRLAEGEMDDEPETLKAAELLNLL